MSKYEPNDKHLTSADVLAGWTLWTFCILAVAVWCEVGTVFSA